MVILLFLLSILCFRLAQWQYSRFQEKIHIESNMVLFNNSAVLGLEYQLVRLDRVTSVSPIMRVSSLNKSPDRCFGLVRLSSNEEILLEYGSCPVGLNEIIHADDLTGQLVRAIPIKNNPFIPQSSDRKIFYQVSELPIAGDKKFFLSLVNDLSPFTALHHSPSMSSSKHYGYFLQWLVLGCLLIGYTIFLMRTVVIKNDINKPS